MPSFIQNILHHYHRPSRLDIIGDVHGHALELEALLKKLDYSFRNGTWKHENRKAVFVGDFLNRGSQNKKTLEIIKKMVENNSAYAILGNHEINAICYFTNRKSGRPIRIPGPTNKRYLDKVKREYRYDAKAFNQTIKWLRSLPLFLDFGTVRIVHAYWSNNHIELLKGARNKKKLTKKLLKEVTKGMSSVSKAFLETTKGVEICFPPHMVVKDIRKIRKISFRVRWWTEPYGKTYNELKYETKSHLPDILIPKHLINPYEVYPKDAPPVFVGHYCMHHGSMLPTPNICCVDSCVANGGKLAAYRWSGEQRLKKEHLVFVDKQY